MSLAGWYGSALSENAGMTLVSVLEIGKEFGPYLLLRRLARGGMGEIWLAEKKGLADFSKRVVIKTILEAFADEPEVVEMFLHEGKVAAQLNHQNIAQTLDLGEIKGVFYIVMEYVNGRDLRNLMLKAYERRELVPLNLVLRIGADTCQGLHHAHQFKGPDGKPAGIIHRDISPQNILVSFDGGVKIVDFGVARALNAVSKTKSGVLKGKYAYMSPEQIEGEALDGRSDVFSLGVVMYEMITGRRLFKRDSEVATLDAVRKAPIPAISALDQSVPRPIEALIGKALERNPNKRFKSAREFQLAIEDLMLGTGLVASAAHLSSYVHELFQEDSDMEQERAGRLEKGMNQLPDIQKADAPHLERTISYTGEKRAGSEALTRNLMVSPRRGRSFRSWLLPALAVLGALGILAVAAWLLFFDQTESNRNTLPPKRPAEEPVLAADTGGGEPSSEPAQTPDAGTESGPDLDALPDAGDGTAAADAGRPLKKPRKPAGGKVIKPETPDIKTER